MGSILLNGVRVLTAEEVLAQALFSMLTLPARPSAHLRHLEIPAFDAKASFLSDAALDLADREMDGADCAGLAAALRLFHPAQLRELHLQRSRMGDGFALVVEALYAMPSLEVVFAMQNQISDAAMAGFTRLAATGGAAGVKQISLQRNRIGSGGVRTLAAALSNGALPGSTFYKLK